MPRNTPDGSVNVSLRGEHATRLREYMAEHGHTVPAQAVREILDVYFASTPLDGAVRAARDNAFNNTKHWILTRMNATFAELGEEIRAETKQIEQSGFGR